MAFWGAMVPHDKPYTLQLNGDHKRIRITHATLADYTGSYWTSAWSKLKCAIGSQPPLYICALSKVLSSRSLELEFEESEEVVFSVKGPQGFHLSGCYVPSSSPTKKDKSTSTDDLPVDCSNAKDIVDEENDEPKNLTAGEDPANNVKLTECDEHKLTAEGDANLAELENLQSNFKAEVDAGNTTTLALPECEEHNNQLENTDVHHHADQNMAKEQPEICALDSELQEDVDNSYVLCIRKYLTVTNNQARMIGNDAGNVRVEANTTVEDARADIRLDENTDAIREANLPSDLLLHLNEDLNRGTEPAMAVSEHFITEDPSNLGTSGLAIETDKVENSSSNKNMLENLVMMVGEAKEQAFSCMGDDNGNGMQEVNGTFDEVDVNCHKHVMDEVTEQKAHSEGDDLPQKFSEIQLVENSPENQLDPYPGEENAGNSLRDEDAKQETKGDENKLTILQKKREDCRPMEEVLVEEHVKKKKPKTESKENENMDGGNPIRTRTLSNGMIIEDVAKGRPNGKKAAPGRKVKIFYTARLRDTGTLLDTNVGENPLTFRLGDEKIIMGLNIGIDGMRIEGKRRLVIPPEIGYGEKVKAHIPPNSWIIYEIELVGVRSGTCRKEKNVVRN